MDVGERLLCEGVSVHQRAVAATARRVRALCNFGSVVVLSVFVGEVILRTAGLGFERCAT